MSENGRPVIDRIAIFNVDHVKFRRDLENGCLEIIVEGRDGHMTITAWNAGDMEQPPAFTMINDLMKEAADG